MKKVFSVILVLGLVFVWSCKSAETEIDKIVEKIEFKEAKGIARHLLIEKDYSQGYLRIGRIVVVLEKEEGAIKIFDMGFFPAYYVNDRLLTGARLVSCEQKEDLLSIIYTNRKVRILYHYKNGGKHIRVIQVDTDDQKILKILDEISYPKN